MKGRTPRPAAGEEYIAYSQTSKTHNQNTKTRQEEADIYTPFHHTNLRVHIIAVHSYFRRQRKTPQHQQQRGASTALGNATSILWQNEIQETWHHNTSFNILFFNYNFNINTFL
jgi:hypothetical protein